MTNQKGAVNIVLVILVVVVALGLGYFGFKNLNTSQTGEQINDNVKNWQTYKNEELGFEMRYPTNMTLSLGHYEPVGGTNVMLGGNIPALVGNITTGGSFVAYFSVYTYPFISNQEQLIHEIKGWGDKYREITVNTLPGFEFQRRLFNGEDETRTYVLFPKGVLEFVCGYSKTECITNNASEILSTFSVRPSLNGDLQGWQTYRNEKYGFEFKYPTLIQFDGYPALVGNDVIEKIKNNKNGSLFFNTAIDPQAQQLGLFGGTVEDKNSSLRILSIGVSSKSKNFSSLKEYVLDIKKTSDIGGKDAAAGYDSQVEPFSSGQTQGYIFRGHDISVFGNASESVFFEKDNYIYQIYFSYSIALANSGTSGFEGAVEESKFEKQKYNLIQEIIKTFKFTP